MHEARGQVLRASRLSGAPAHSNSNGSRMGSRMGSNGKESKCMGSNSKDSKDSKCTDSNGTIF